MRSKERLLIQLKQLLSVLVKQIFGIRLFLPTSSHQPWVSIQPTILRAPMVLQDADKLTLKSALPCIYEY